MSTRTPVPFTRNVGPNFDVAPGVVGLRSLIVNVYFVSLADADGVGKWVLIDAGLPVSGHGIRSTAAKLFGDGQPPEAIFLTHGHFDHTGVLKTLADEWDVPIYAHPLEHPYLSGRASYAPPDPWAGGSMAWTSPLYPRGPIDVSDRLQPFPADGTLPFLSEWRWIATPGHSPGHVSFYRDRDKTLIAGDAFVTTRQEYLSTVVAQTQLVCGPPMYFTHDWGAAEQSVKTLAVLEPETAATGHGTPMHGDALRDQLHAMAEHFETQIPTGGRYADRPVVYDETGPEQVPPAKPVPRAAIAVGVGLAILGVASLAAAAATAKHVHDER